MTIEDTKLLGLLTSGLANQKFTFSIFCRSGILKTIPCECWRCREERGLEPDEELASVVAAGADMGMNFRLQEERLEHNAKNQLCQ